MSILLEIFRLIILSGMFLIVVVTADILGVYWRTYKANRTQGRLLPQHIWLIVLSYLLFAAGAAYHVIDRLGEHNLSLSTPVYAIATFVGLIALNKVRKHVYNLRNS